MTDLHAALAKLVVQERARNFLAHYARARYLAVREEWQVPAPRSADEALRHELVARVLGDWQRQWRTAGR